MEYRTFGKTGIEVSRIGLGCYQMGGTHGGGGWPGMDDGESVRTIHHAETLGVNLLDTAEGYGAGHSERIIGRALADRRSRYVVATKVAPPVDGDSEADARNRVQTACAGSLQRLGTDYIDIYQLHGVPPSELMPAVAEELTALQQAGKIRCWGISTNDADTMRELLGLGDLAMAQVGLSIVNPTADDALALALEANLGTLIRVPLGPGSPDRQVLRHPAARRRGRAPRAVHQPARPRGARQAGRAALPDRARSNDGAGSAAFRAGHSRRDGGDSGRQGPCAT